MRNGGVISRLSRIFSAIVALTSMVPGGGAAATLGGRVDNIAQISYSTVAGPASLTTPTASFVVEAARTPSDIEFFRYAPMAPDAVAVSLNGSDFQLAVSGAFQPVGPMTTAGGSVIPAAAPVPIVPAQAYFPGEPIIVRVSDAGQNGDPQKIETIVATIRTANGDFVTLRLYESGPDTGAFYAWINSASGAPVQNDGILTIAKGADITARYQDPFDATEISTDLAGVDPFGRVFDSLTGALIDGAAVTVVDDATGQPAQVYGVDGVSTYPSTIVAGQSVTDAGGMVYPANAGEFRFPIMMPGTYRLVVTPPDGYSAPSTVSAPAFVALANAPFTIVPGSYGQPFTLAGAGDVELDFPLDPYTDILVTKRADVDAAAVGDFIRYRVSIENRAATAANVRIADELPPGLRYQKGSARLDGAAIADPAASGDGRSLTFSAGLVGPGAVAELSYVVEVAAGARTGAAVNRAHAVSADGAVLSNRAEAAVEIEDDFLRSGLTIVGRIVEGGCEAKAGEADGHAGEGVAGVRLYMENGATVVSDENGLYHFEDVAPRTHVVQVDEASLPQGRALVLCKDNTRRAGSARSQFVDATGGKVWRADFHIRKTKDAAAAPAATSEKPAFNADREYLAYDKIWLNQQTDAVLSWAYPASGVTPSSPSVNIGVKHDPKLRPTLYVNGHEAPRENFAGREVSIMRTVALTRWKGVDLLSGVNRVDAVLKDETGAEVARISRSIDYIDEAALAELAPEETRAFADGGTKPVIAIRFTDGAGRPVRAGRLVNVDIAPPYRAATREAIERAAPLDAPLSATTGVPVGQGGVALIELEPTVETGLARIRVKLDGGAEKSFAVYVKPALRDWIIVGLAESEGGLRKDRGALNSGKGSTLIGDGRIAGFAKGTIKGGWLITAAGDSKNKRHAADDAELFDAVDPDDRYPLYGDASNQRFEAQSRYPIYLKAEKNGFKAQFGDYDTGMADTRLARYSRRLSGLQTVYDSERFAFTGFAAETNQAFVKDELAADGTSGPLSLSAAPLIRNSETIHVETRDRFRPDVVLGSTTLIRYADYDIDFETGEIIFRLPVPAADPAFNPNIIVIDYETAAPVDRNLTAGGRGAMRFLAGRGELGASFIHEEAPGVSGARANLAGADAKLDLTSKDQLRVEYARTMRDHSAIEDADAVLAEVSHTGDRLAAKAYYARVEPDFGLAQQTSAIVGAERYGAEASVKLGDFEDSAGAARGARYVDAKAYREENLTTGAARELAEIALRQESTSTSGSLGLRGVRETPASGPEREGLFAVASANQRFNEIGLSLRVAHERPIAGEDGSSLFPKRFQVGFDQRLFEGFTLSATHEILDGDAVSQANTTVGLTAEPWAGGKITLAGDRVTQDSGERVGATLGVDQQVRLSKNWTGSLGMARREDLRQRGAVDASDDILPDAARSPFEETGGAYTSLYVGAGYRNEATSGSSRFEMKKTDAGQRYMVAAGAARELSEQFSFAGAGRFQADNNELLADERRFDLRLGAAWRPHDDGLIVFNRFDIKQREVDQDSESWKAVHNMTLNAMATDRLQIAFNHGFKYSVFRTADARYDGVTELVGLEARYDITDRIDIGFHGEGIYAFNSKTLDYSWGPSVGVTPADNVWLSFGWNFEGFVDEDFAAADYSRAGPYLKLRIKFDQMTAKGLLDAISPERSQ